MSLASMPTIMSRTRRAHRKAITPKPDQVEQKRLKEEADCLSSSFEEFVKAAWPIVYPGRKLVWEWHMEEMCRALDEAARLRKDGIITKWCINVPPGTSKSSIGCIMWQPWVWTWWPESCWITTTHEAGLAQDQSRDSRDLISSSWYQERWPLKLKRGAMRQNHWENSRGGSRSSAGTGGTVTGRHGEFVLSDDLIAEQDARQGSPSVVARRMIEAEGFFFGTLHTREIAEGATRVYIGQRLHAKDPAARAIKEGYRTIIFPAHFDPARADPRDRRTEAGEVICPGFRGPGYWDELIIPLGPTGARAQLEQNPGDPEDKLLRREYFAERWTELPLQLKETMRVKRVGPGQRWITAWDLTFKEKTLSAKSWVVGQVWCAFEERFYLVDQVRDHMGFRQSVEAIKDLARRYPWITKHLLEDAANAAACQDELRAKVAGIILEPVGGGTFARTQAVEGVWATGAVVTPADAPWMGGSTGFIEEHVDFDGTGTTDQVSASSLALVHFNSGDKGQRFRESMAKLRQSPTFRRMVSGF